MSSAAASASTRANVDDEIGSAHGVFVVLDDDDGVAKIAHMLERSDELFIVTLVQSDGWLVEDVEHAHQPAADLGGETDALGFAAGKRASGTGKSEISEADVHEETQTLRDFLQD